jgi:hypothetical protein
LLIAASVLILAHIYKPEKTPKERIPVTGAFVTLSFGG